MTSVPAKALSEPVMTMAPTFASSSAFFNASFNSMNKAEFKAFNAFGRFNAMSSTPGSGLETRRFSYLLVPVAMVRTVKLSRDKEEAEESRDVVVREETRSEAFKSENAGLRDMSPDQHGGNSFKFSPAGVPRVGKLSESAIKPLNAHRHPRLRRKEGSVVTKRIGLSLLSGRMCSLRKNM